MSLFSGVEQAPPDAILGLTEQFKADTNPKKVNLGVGVYQDASGKLPLLRCVETAEQRMAASPKAKGYLAIDGIPTYDTDVKELVFGAGSPLLEQGRVITVQALGGTGALKVGADLLRQVSPDATVLISNPSWENHQALFTRAGFTVEKYRYYDAEAKGVDVEGMIADLRAAAPGTIVVLHACCHNPTGYDLAPADWQRVIEAVSRRPLTVPRHGLSGLQAGHRGGRRRRPSVRRAGRFVPRVDLVQQELLAVRRARGRAVGGVRGRREAAKRVLSQLKIVIRTNYSNPPTHGAASWRRCSATRAARPVGRRAGARCATGSSRCAPPWSHGLVAAGVEGRHELHHRPGRHVQLLGPDQGPDAPSAPSSPSTAPTPAASAWRP
jgi:aromatic-amino-acid transaminase